LTFYRDNADDPYITLKENDEDDERQDLEILPTDNLLVTAKTEDEISQLEIYVYDETQENVYVHHDLMLPNFPLCLEWLDFPPASSSSAPVDSAAKWGNYIAVGSLDPEIEIWSLDVIESMYPDMVLGQPDKTAAHVPVPAGTGKKKRKKNKSETDVGRASRRCGARAVVEQSAPTDARVCVCRSDRQAVGSQSCTGGGRGREWSECGCDTEFQRPQGQGAGGAVEREGAYRFAFWEL
jgi:hypothetical protein